MTRRLATCCIAFSAALIALVLVAATAETLGTPPVAPDTTKDNEMQKSNTAPSEETPANHLIHETSPYLLQHAHNPVDWYPWGDEAIQRARDEDKPIFLSIGYAACHWCHVMERESFEDPSTAAFLNEHFISIKVDREERPDLDTLYMTAVQLMTGRGGWPMSVFLTPGLKPFYGGTYFPPDDRYGMPSFKTVLKAVLDSWRDRRSDILNGAAQLTEHVARSANQSVQANDAVFTDALLGRATQQLAHDYDPQFGGFTPAPKFPAPFAIAALLREYNHTKDQHTLDMATFTLKQMANGGMYDHLGGGFHRYSVDERWLVPHFEKMLYDNALLSQVYLEAYQVTHNPLFRRVAEETFAYVIRDMQSGDGGPLPGGFYSTEDADSEGLEGKFYIWTCDEIVSALGEHDASLFCAYYNVQPTGNFPSHESCHNNQNTLHVTQDPESFAASQGISFEEWKTKLSAMRVRLLTERAHRVRPVLDDKILTSWNALMLSSLAQGYQVLGNEAYRNAATRAADFLIANMMPNGELLHVHRNGRSHVSAYLDDYAFLLVAFVDLYEATFEPKWLDHADALAAAMVARFWDNEHGGFFFTAAGQDNLIARSKPVFDGAEPSGNAMAALGLLRLARLTDNADLATQAARTLVAVSGNLAAAPHGMFKTLCAVDFFVHPPKEVAIIGPIASEPARALLKTLHECFIPNKVVAAADPANGTCADIGKRLPLLKLKGMVEGRPAAYVCRNFVCERPVTAPEALAALLVSD